MRKTKPSPFLEEMHRLRGAIKEQRQLKRMKITKEGIQETLVESHGVYGKLLTHPAMVGVNTAGDVLKRVCELYDEKIKSKKTIGSPNEDHPYFHKWVFSYDMKFGNGVKGIPTQKNKLSPRKNSKGGKGFFNNPDIVKLRDDIEHQWGMQHNFEYPELRHVLIDLTIYFPTFRESDADGKETSILDALVARKILAGDDYMKLGPTYRKPMYRSGKAGFDIIIYQLEEEYFNTLIGKVK